MRARSDISIAIPEEAVERAEASILISGFGSVPYLDQQEWGGA